MEKMNPDVHEWGYIGREFTMHKMWVLNAAEPIVAAHLKSMIEFPPSQASDTLNVKKALEEIQAKMEKAAAGGASR